MRLLKYVFDYQYFGQRFAAGFLMGTGAGLYIDRHIPLRSFAWKELTLISLWTGSMVAITPITIPAVALIAHRMK